jgi:Fe2+ or Zn2+ uptake regulation protein
MRCDKCGRVTDIPADAVPEICSCAAKATGLRITGCSILFHGVCRDCEQN